MVVAVGISVGGAAGVAVVVEAVVVALGIGVWGAAGEVVGVDVGVACTGRCVL